MTQPYDPRQQQPAAPPQWQQYPQYLPQQRHPQVAPKSPMGAVLASALVPGLGSMMCGHAGRGVWLLVLWAVSCVLCLVFIGFLLAPAFWIGGMVMAHSDARAWNRAHGIIS